MEALEAYKKSLHNHTRIIKEMSGGEGIEHIFLLIKEHASIGEYHIQVAKHRWGAYKEELKKRGYKVKINGHWMEISWGHFTAKLLYDEKN